MICYRDHNVYNYIFIKACSTTQLEVRLAQLSAAPALHALVLYIPVLHCTLREIGSGSACHQRGAQEAGYSVLRPAPSQCIYREGAGAAESYAKHTLNICYITGYLDPTKENRVIGYSWIQQHRSLPSHGSTRQCYRTILITILLLKLIELFLIFLRYIISLTLN